MRGLACVTVGVLAAWWLLCWTWVDANTFMVMDNSTVLSRHKRNLPLVFPQGGIFKLILGFGIPIKNPANISLVFALNFQYQYPVPPNITFFTQYYAFTDVAKRKRRSYPKIEKGKDRSSFYTAVESTMDGLGVNGRECLLRSICEAAETPIHHHNGLLGDLLHTMLTPVYDDCSTDPFGNCDTLYENIDYSSAREAGEQMYDCRELYPQCPLGHGLFDLISILE